MWKKIAANLWATFSWQADSTRIASEVDGLCLGRAWEGQGKIPHRSDFPGNSRYIPGPFYGYSGAVKVP